MLRKLIGDVMRSGFLLDEKVKNLLPVALSSMLERLAKHLLWARVMDAIIKNKIGLAAWIADRPSREALRDLNDVLLRVAAVHAKRVKLHQLAAIVLVQPTLIAQSRKIFPRAA